MQAFAKAFNLLSELESKRILPFGYNTQTNFLFLIFISIESKFFGFPALNVYKNLNHMPTAKADSFSFSVNKIINFFEIDFLSFRPT